MVKLALLVLAQILYSAAYIIYFTYSFEYERRLIGLHVCVLAVLISSGLMTAALASRLHHRLTRVAIAIVTVTGFGFLTSLYAANLVSSATWGGIVNAEIALRYAARPAVLLRYLLTVVDWRLVAFSGLAMTAPMIYLAQSRIIADGLTSMLDGTTRRRRLAVTAIAAMGIVPAFVAVALVYFTPTTERMALLRREPLVGFFIDSVAASPAFAVNRASIDATS